jgi:hypothetical protein
MGDCEIARSHANPKRFFTKHDLPHCTKGNPEKPQSSRAILAEIT